MELSDEHFKALWDLTAESSNVLDSNCLTFYKCLFLLIFANSTNQSKLHIPGTSHINIKNFALF
jgi:hypothetical protein